MVGQIPPAASVAADGQCALELHLAACNNRRIGPASPADSSFVGGSKVNMGSRFSVDGALEKLGIIAAMKTRESSGTISHSSQIGA
jgi:hypothetical protein